MKNKCGVAECDLEIAVKKHGLCKAHTERYYRHGHPGTEKILSRKKHKPYVNKAAK